jgi:hypothetical protein
VLVLFGWQPHRQPGIIADSYALRLYHKIETWLGQRKSPACTNHAIGRTGDT